MKKKILNVFLNFERLKEEHRKKLKNRIFRIKLESKNVREKI